MQLGKYVVEVTEKVPHGREVTLFVQSGKVRFSKDAKTKHVLELTPDAAQQLAADGYKVTPAESGKAPASAGKAPKKE